jgi:hypothetical protein
MATQELRVELLTYPGQALFAYCTIPMDKLLSSSAAERYFEVPVFAYKLDETWKVTDTNVQLSEMSFKSSMWCSPHKKGESRRSSRRKSVTQDT